MIDLSTPKHLLIEEIHKLRGERAILYEALGKTTEAYLLLVRQPQQPEASCSDNIRAEKLINEVKEMLSHYD